MKIDAYVAIEWFLRVGVVVLLALAYISFNLFLD